MFDARRLLDQVMGAAAPSGAGGLASGLGSRPDLVKGALAGGLVGVLLGNRRARRMVGKGAGTALKLGGLAAVGALAYTAWQRHKAAQDTAAPALHPPPGGSAFLPGDDAGDALARGVLVAMIQGAKADGHIDAEEQRRIFAHVEAMGLDAGAKAFVMDELAAPGDVARVTAYARSPETAADLYAAALLAMDPDTAAERDWLDRLARGLGLDPGLAAELERTVAESAADV